MNHMIHIAEISQIRLDTGGRTYYRRKRAEGKRPLEAIRCLKRSISDAIYRQLVADATAASPTGMDAGPGGHRGASQESSAAGSHPHTGTSDQPLPGPASPTLQPARATGKTTAAGTLGRQSGARRDAVVRGRREGSPGTARRAGAGERSQERRAPGPGHAGAASSVT